MPHAEKTPAASSTRPTPPPTTHAHATTRAGRPQKPPAYTGPSPFSSLLAEYLWNSRDSRNRPLTVGQLAIRLGISRATVNTWVHRNATPDLDNTLATLAKLNIPVASLLHHYRAAGIPVPPLTANDTAAADAAAAAARPTPAAAPAPPQAAPEPTANTQPQAHPQPEPPDAWTEMITATAASLHDAGLPDSVIAATIASLRAQQTGEPTPVANARQLHHWAQRTRHDHTAEQDQQTDDEEQRTTKTPTAHKR